MSKKAPEASAVTQTPANAPTGNPVDTTAAAPDTAAAPTPPPTGPKPLPVPKGGWPKDEFTGLAGEFIRDPLTGIRRPASKAQPEGKAP